MNDKTTRGHGLDSLVTWSGIAAAGLCLVRYIIDLAGCAVVLLALAAFGTSLTLLVKQLRSRRLRAAQPLLVAAFLMLFWTYIPHLIVEGVLLVHQPYFEQVVSDVQTGRLVSQELGLIDVPRGYGLATSGADQVLVHGQGETLTVLFLTSRGAVGGWVGYAFVAADPFQPDDPDLKGEYIKAHWYWVGSN